MIVVAGETPFDGRGQLRAVFMLEIVIPTGRRIQHLDLQRGYPQGEPGSQSAGSKAADQG
ncbi:MAG TPA: hypothetical protein VH853_13655 [Polyangia bacterium]|jgi:hypothetical protein|nr:hypothetical protein [Polyangia bacterium]